MWLSQFRTARCLKIANDWQSEIGDKVVVTPSPLSAHDEPPELFEALVRLSAPGTFRGPSQTTNILFRESFGGNHFRRIREEPRIFVQQERYVCRVQCGLRQYGSQRVKKNINFTRRGKAPGQRRGSCAVGPINPFFELF